MTNLRTNFTNVLSICPYSSCTTKRVMYAGNPKTQTKLILPTFISEKLHHAMWLNRLEGEKSEDRLFLIQTLFISLKSYRSFYVFDEPPPDDLSEMNVIQYANPVKLAFSFFPPATNKP